MYNLMIIGAGVNQIPAISMAKQRGYRLVVTDMSETAVGLKLADETGIVSTRDVDKTVEFARHSNSHNPIDGVMTMASESAITVAKVAEALGVPGVCSAAAFNATNKAKRLTLFEKAQVPTSRFAVITTSEEAIQAANTIGWPVVIKPVDSAGSRGVQKVLNPTSMAQAFEQIRRVSANPAVVIEEFLTGTEHSVEGIVIGGKVYWLGFSDRNYANKEIYPPYFLEDGDTMPSALSSETVEDVMSKSTRAVNALGINWGPVKGDILIDSKKGIRVLEMAARLSGDYFCDETIPLHNGINLLEIVMDMSVGNEISKEQLEPLHHRGVALRYVWPRPGKVISVQGVSEAEKTPGVVWVRFEPKYRNLQPGVTISPPTYMAERVASVMATAETSVEAISIAEKAVALIEIQTVL